MTKILLIASFAESLINFRGALILALQSRGLQVHVAAPNMPTKSTIRIKLEAAGVIVHEVSMQRTGTNPVADFLTLVHLWILMRRIRPKYMLGYTIKPVIYGSMAAWAAGVPRRFALITGLGYTLQNVRRWGILKIIIQRLYAISLSFVHTVFFHNSDDESSFRQCALLDFEGRTCVINGSGVDVDFFKVVPLPLGRPCFLLMSRLLGDKGVREYAEAARRIRIKYPDVRCVLAGWIDTNPDAIAQEELDIWIADGVLEFLGRLDDVRPAIASCSVYVLPSYHEGTPRSVLEAMSMGRAIITSDAPGCRETVLHRKNGLLVNPKSINELEQAMLEFINDEGLAARMGAQSRHIAQVKYDVHKVNAAMMDEMKI